MPKKRRKLRRVKKKRRYKLITGKDNTISPDQVLLQTRQVLLFGQIDTKKAKEVIERLMTLNSMSHEPILLWINSGGGSVSDGFAIIDAMRGLQGDIYTIINGRACSMAGLIAISGNKRYMTEHSIFLAHDMYAGVEDYSTKIADRADFFKEEQKKLFGYLGKHTKLSKAELERARNGELWLYPSDCLKKGIVDIILKHE